MFRLEAVIFVAFAAVILCAEAAEVIDVINKPQCPQDDVSATFAIEGKQYFYASYGKKWFIRELLDNGIIGLPTDEGVWDDFSTHAFAFVVNERHFLYILNNSSWNIYELLPGGKIYKKTDSGEHPSNPTVIFAYTIDGDTYIHCLRGSQWSITNILPHGRVGSQTDSGKWKYSYASGFPVSIEGKQYFYAVSRSWWFIQELLPEGRMGNETDKGSPHYHAKEPFFPLTVDNQNYFCGVTSGNDFFVRELLPGGKIGAEKLRQSWPSSFPVSFTWNTEGRQLIYSLRDYKNYLREIRGLSFTNEN